MSMTSKSVPDYRIAALNDVVQRFLDRSAESVRNRLPEGEAGAERAILQRFVDELDRFLFEYERHARCCGFVVHVQDGKMALAVHAAGRCGRGPHQEIVPATLPALAFDTRYEDRNVRI